MTPLNRFFVYGTLRPGEQRFTAIQSYLEKEPESAQLLGARLYTTGPWPFIVLDGMSQVVGELLTVRPETLNTVIRTLDNIEGYEEGYDDCLFVRSIQDIYIPEGYSVEDGYVKAYVYLGGRSLVMQAAKDRYKELRSGDWKKRFEEDKRKC